MLCKKQKICEVINCVCKLNIFDLSIQNKPIGEIKKQILRPFDYLSNFQLTNINIKVAVYILV